MAMFKSQLQEYAQRAGWMGPVYDIQREGPSHEPKFKAVVTVGDETFESPDVYSNLKKAEHAAAKAALSAFSGRPELQQIAFPGPLHQSGLCKNLLQEFAQKSKLPIPMYVLIKSGPTHSPLFTATVKIDGVVYKGGLSRNKKEAEIKAAKTALLAICAERGGTPEQAFGSQLDMVGKEPPPAAEVSRPPSTNVTRKRNRYNRGYPRRGTRRFQAGEGHYREGHYRRFAVRRNASHPGSFGPEHGIGPVTTLEFPGAPLVSA